MKIFITELHSYPVKSCAGMDLKEVSLGPKGLQYDREWMVINGDKRFLSQRETPKLALVTPNVTEDALILTAPETPSIQVPLNYQGETKEVQVWKDWCQGIDQGDASASWLSAYLKIDCRLVRMAPNYLRQVDPQYASIGDPVGFADGFPFLLISEGSLEDLNSRLEQPIPMNRFRPNIVVSGCAPFAEDTWKNIQISTIPFGVAKPCARCAITTIDQETLVKSKEPLATLAKYRRGESGGVLFGQNLISRSTGVLHVGDSLVVIQEKNENQ